MTQGPGASPRSQLVGRRVIVTGGASGIGRATSMLLASRGARVVVLDRDDDAAERLVAEVRPAPGGDLSFEHVDVASQADVSFAVARAIARLSGVDVMIHTAGIMAGQLEELATVTEATWDRVLDVNLKGTFLVVQRVAAAMTERGSGVIILVSSKAGVTVGSGSYAYGASKGGMHGLALTLDRHLGPKGIRVNEVCPGDVDTPLYRASLSEALAHGADPGLVDEATRHLATPAVIAEVLAFLATESAAAVRGTIFTA